MQGLQSLLGLLCCLRRQPQHAGTTDADGSGAIMILAWFPSCLALCVLPLHKDKDKLWTAQESSTLDGSLPHQESKIAGAALGTKIQSSFRCGDEVFGRRYNCSH